MPILQPRVWLKIITRVDRLRRANAPLLLALAALVFGFLLAGQLRAQLITGTNRVAQNEALARTAHDLERSNGVLRKQVSELRTEITRLQARQAERSQQGQRLQDELADLRLHAGLTRLRGPGVTVSLASGKPPPDGERGTDHLVGYQDVQDVVNLLFDAGAEGVAVNGHRISPATAYRGSGTTVVIDQGPPLHSPFKFMAVGNRAEMERMLDDPTSLASLRGRQLRYQLELSWTGAPDLSLPPYDSALEAEYARPIQ